MRTSEDITRDIEEIIRRNYYNEGHELTWGLKSYEESLSRGERDLLKRVVLERLTADPSNVNVLLVSCWHMPEAVPVLRAALDDEPRASQLSRTLMHVLQRYSDEGACRAVERFLDSEQETEALTFLARMDFVRAAPRLKQALKKERLSDVCLHILAERWKVAGLHQLIEDVRVHVTGDSDFFRRQVHRVLQAKQGDYNPFTEEDISHILAGLKR